MRPPGFQDINGNHVTVGDHCGYAFGGTAEIRDVLQDGDAEIIWLSGPPGVKGTHDTVKWYNLTKIAEKPIKNPAGNVAGYTAQPDEKVALVNEFKADEERLLRKLDRLRTDTGSPVGASKENTPGVNYHPPFADPRWIAIARTHFQEGFMALNRAVFQPQRIALPEDEK